jgi:hypothetical protein
MRLRARRSSSIVEWQQRAGDHPSCLAFVDAEREYYARNPQQVPLLQFAQKSSAATSEGRPVLATTEDEPRARSAKALQGHVQRAISRRARP